MNQREDFEAWIARMHPVNKPTPNEYFGMKCAWQAGQAAKDAEIAELRTKLAKCREFISKVEDNDLKTLFIANMQNWSSYKAAKEACGL